MKLGVIGAGNVGTAVVTLAADYGHVVTAFADSESAVIDEDGIDVEAAIERKRTSGRVGDEESATALEGHYDVLVEATPTNLDDAEPGFSHVREALQRDRHVVLANKGPVALRYSEVRELENESQGAVRFGATIGGALPVISTMEAIGQSQIYAVSGALDPTANFVLSRMATEGLDYEHVLAEAQDLGVAESDSSFEIDGVDTALKAVIIANVLWDDGEYALADAEIEGISGLSGSLLDLAKEDGSTIRLIAEIANREVRVGPRLINEDSPIASSGTTTAVQLETAHAGRLNLSGQGTGGMETASTVLSDIKTLEE